MKPDTSHWRTDAAYAVMDRGGVDHLAWECLRRNGDYQRDFATLLRQGRLEQPVPEPMERRWGLRFRGAAPPFSH